MNLHQFYVDSIIRCRNTKERYGQALFNQLVEVRPDLSEQIRGTDADPFYLKGPSDNYAKWDRFIRFVEKNWYNHD